MEERIKDLKNKNIKIRRVKKNEMAESVVLLKEDIDRPSFAYSQVERVPSVAQSVIVQAPEFRPSPMKQGRKIPALSLLLTNKLAVICCH